MHLALALYLPAAGVHKCMHLLGAGADLLRSCDTASLTHHFNYLPS